MLLALVLVLLIFWWFLWGIFHLAGGPIHIVLAAAFLLALYRVVQSSRTRGA